MHSLKQKKKKTIGVTMAAEPTYSRLESTRKYGKHCIHTYFVVVVVIRVLHIGIVLYYYNLIVEMNRKKKKNGK